MLQSILFFIFVWVHTVLVYRFTISYKQEHNLAGDNCKRRRKKNAKTVYPTVRTENSNFTVDYFHFYFPT